MRPGSSGLLDLQRAAAALLAPQAVADPPPHVGVAVPTAGPVAVSSLGPSLPQVHGAGPCVTLVGRLACKSFRTAVGVKGLSIERLWVGKVAAYAGRVNAEVDDAGVAVGCTASLRVIRSAGPPLQDYFQYRV